MSKLIKKLKNETRQLFKKILNILLIQKVLEAKKLKIENINKHFELYL